MRGSLSACLFAGAAFVATFLAVGIPEAEARRYVYYPGDRYGYGERLHFDVDGNLAIPFANDRGATTLNVVGLGVDARLGYRAGTRYVFIQPEALVGLQDFPIGGPGVGGHGLLGRAMVGARLGGGRLVQPQGFFHLGAAFGDLKAGFAYDVGGALDFKFRHVNFGAHAAFNMAVLSNQPGGGGTVKWIAVGPHIGFSFL
jgi:hypothetical protein